MVWANRSLDGVEGVWCRAKVARCRVQGSGLRLQGLGPSVEGVGCRVRTQGGLGDSQPRSEPDGTWLSGSGFS